MIKKYKVLILIIILASFLRFYKLDSVPVSMFGDEMDVGYHAYSVLKTGKDYYGNFLPLHFHSIAEWRTPLYLYSAVPTVALFGISPLGVRLPAAIFGVLGVLAFYLLVKIIRKEYLAPKSTLFGNSNLENLAGLLLAVSPWHIQYSRAGFEVTEVLFFLAIGLYFFFTGLKKSRYLYLAALSFGLMPWIYSTAKLFTPMLVLALVVLYFSRLIKLSWKDIFGSGALLALLVAPMAYSILFGGGAQRFSYISVFSDPTVEHEVGVARDVDNWGNSIVSRTFHNKFTIWSEAIGNNFLQSFSTGFLFVNGDINLRHSIEDVGMFYKIEFFALLLGIIYFFHSKAGTRTKLLFLFWIFGGVIPSAITRDGGNHATRLILILMPLVFLVAYGVLMLSRSRILAAAYALALLGLFINYQHLFWVHNPTYSERWWHYGWKEAIQSIKEVENKYDKIVISTAGEPPLVFFAASYEYPPEKWHSEFPRSEGVVLDGKFYFESLVGDVYEWGKQIDNKTLYLASEREVGPNLIREPERTPGNLILLDSVAFPSGEPAFYLFSGKAGDEN